MNMAVRHAARPRVRKVASWLAAACCAAALCAPISRAQVLTNCLDILKLSPAEASQERLVKVRGVISCNLPASQLLFLQDQTAGIYLFPAQWPRDLAWGEVVEVEGVTGPGRFSPIIVGTSVRRVGETGRIDPKVISIEELNTGRFDAQWVSISGVVRSFRPAPGCQVLEVCTGSQSVRTLVFGLDLAEQDLVDARVKLTGVAGTFFEGDRLDGFGIFVPRLEDFVITKAPAPDPFAVPQRPLNKLAWFSPEGGMDHRIKVRGVVTAHWPGEALFVEDGGKALRVLPIAALPDLKPGQLVEASGFLAGSERDESLVRAKVRKLSDADLPKPEFTDLEKLPSRPPDGRFLAAEGVVQSVRRVGPGSSLLMLNAGEQDVAVFLRAPAPLEWAGAQIRVAGAWSRPPSGISWLGRAGLWVPATNSVAMLAPAPVPRLSAAPVVGTLPIAGALLAAAGFGTAAWLYRKRSRTSILAADEAVARAQKTERQVAALNDARERLGRDLHDHIIQTIYAIGLNVDDCSRSLREEPEATATRLKTSLMDINGVIRELRSVILGLETYAIQPQEFRTALKSLGLTLGHEKSSGMRLQIEESAIAALSPAQATELVHIAREAMSNSVRHGQAETTTFSLRLAGPQIQFVIEDDGRGFDPSSDGPKGFGLRNMARRAENLGARFDVSSSGGRGTRIVLDIPRQKQQVP